MGTQRIYAEHAATITQAKANPNGLLEQAGGTPVVVLAHNKPRYYMVPPEMFESMVDALEIVLRESRKEAADFPGQFRPGRKRMDQIAESCADIIYNNRQNMDEFEEW